MPNDSPTQRTDALGKNALDSNDIIAWRTLARTLERELSALRSTSQRDCVLVPLHLTEAMRAVSADWPRSQSFSQVLWERMLAAAPATSQRDLVAEAYPNAKNAWKKYQYVVAPSPLGSLADILAEYDAIVIARLDPRDAEADFVMRGSDWRVLRTALDEAMRAAAPRRTENES